MAKKLTSSELPSGFSVEKYLFTKQLDAAGWANALVLRVGCKGQITIADEYAKYRNHALHVTQLLIDAPMADMLDGWRPSIHDEFAKSTVSDYSAMEFLDLATHLDKSVAAQPFLQRYELAGKSPYRDGEYNPEADAARDLLSNTPHWNLFGIPPSSRSAVAAIDLDAPDDVLVADFRQWLTTARRNREIPASVDAFDSSDFLKWAEMRVLAYLDLSLWAAARGVKIPLPIMGRALFPDEFAIGLEDRVRKVIARDARKLLDSRTIRALRLQSQNPDR
ncbi:DUF6387 family protein [Paraburkholderia ferrariae]|uniref:DUF6387 family protein n=1 Tax=Paraburkholderia ferrariae TaxID=386056 RepID=UPI000486C026|nr:DUF6387 family protein [Paraburkholderia ferrariae]